MSVDLTGEPFDKYRPACEMCERFPMGGYDFNCKRCLARLYVRGMPREQARASKAWRATMTPAEQEEMRQLIAEERSALPVG